MKTVKTVFGCDHCLTQVEREEGFPYAEGWVYLYSLNFQKKNASDSEKYERFERRDLHFCSKKCMLAYLGGLLGD